MLLSILIGLSLGLFGGGGSILAVPVLHYVFGLEAHVAIATSLLVVGVTAVFALIPHAQAGRVVWRTAWPFAVASMVGAFGAGRVAHHLPGQLLLVLFGAMMLATAIAMLRRKPDAAPTPRTHSLGLIAVEGLVVGAITGLVGAGGGFLVVPALVILGGLAMVDAIGTALVVIALKSFAGFAGHAGGIAVDYKIAALVVVLALGGAIAGSILAGRLSAARLSAAFGWFLVAMAVFVLAQEVPRVFAV